MRNLRFTRVCAAAGLALAAASTGVVHAPAAHADPNFKAPFPCGQKWTYSHHSAEVRRALDFVSSSGATAGTPVLASAPGTATRHNEPGGAGQYVVVDHGGGWKTYYFHLASYTAANGARVGQGQELGRTGTTGSSTGAHIHYEQLLNGVGQNIRINGTGLPYPGSYNSNFLTSDNACANTPKGKIGEKWNALGGNASVVGKPITGEQPSKLNGIFQQFERGIIIWRADMGARPIYGEILKKFWATGAEPVWGFPTMDEMAAAASPAGTTGRYQYFQNGLLLWSSAHGAHAVSGQIEKAFADNGREKELGYPTSDATEADGTLTQTFEKATIRWSQSEGAVVTRG
ncbi:peptidoglycan DD-metalloendopeptidase family protein [Dermacoccaceae bacterium W4C1]